MNTNNKIAIIDYGAGNIQSILFALERLGYEGFLTYNSFEIKNAHKVIFPGVGEASSAMNLLIKSGLHEVIPTLKQPVLGICLGMQLMCKYSEEGNTQGLNIFDVDIKRFTNQVKVPQMGWNTISDLKTTIFNQVEDQSYIYMVHSFYADICNNTIAITQYDIKYSSALQKDNFFGLQFHPEKSGKIGEQILKNFLELN